MRITVTDQPRAGNCGETLRASGLLAVTPLRIEIGQYLVFGSAKVEPIALQPAKRVDASLPVNKPDTARRISSNFPLRRWGCPCSKLRNIEQA
jgi:hypothetical protein